MIKQTLAALAIFGGLALPAHGCDRAAQQDTLTRIEAQNLHLSKIHGTKCTLRGRITFARLTRLVRKVECIRDPMSCMLDHMQARLSTAPGLKVTRTDKHLITVEGR